MFKLTPELLQKGLTGLGIAAGQLRNVTIEEDTKKALVRFVMGAIGSGDVNGYVKTRLAWLEERDLEPARPSSVRVTSRVVPVEGEFDDDQRTAQRRRK